MQKYQAEEFAGMEYLAFLMDFFMIRGSLEKYVIPDWLVEYPRRIDWTQRQECHVSGIKNPALGMEASV